MIFKGWNAVERRGVHIVVPLLLFVEKGEVYMIIYLGRQ